MNRMLETIQLPHLPNTLPLYITFYHSLQNAAFLRQQLLTGNTEYEYAFIDARMVLQPLLLPLPLLIFSKRQLHEEEADMLGTR